MKINYDVKNMGLAIHMTLAENGVLVELPELGASVVMKQKIFINKEDLIKELTDKINELYQL
jgi:hypothetical protein